MFFDIMNIINVSKELYVRTFSEKPINLELGPL